MNINIEDHIRQSIYEYPSLFRVRNDPRMSRLCVLDHMFFCIGTGMEWDRDTGTMNDGSGDEGMSELPEGFFEKELYEIEVEADKIDGFIALLESENRFFYRRSGKTVWNDDAASIVFEADHNQAAKYQIEWGNSRFGISDDPKWIYVDKMERGSGLKPYPLGQFSPVVELIEGKTDSLHIPNYSFDEYPPDPQWVAAACDLAKEALEYYNDKDRYCNDYRYDKPDFKEYKQGQIDILNTFLEKWNDERKVNG